MVWNGDTHDLFSYSAIVDRPRLTWPNGAHVVPLESRVWEKVK